MRMSFQMHMSRILLQPKYKKKKKKKKKIRIFRISLTIYK